MGYAISNLESIKEGPFSFIKNVQGLTLITNEKEEVIRFEQIISFISGYIVDINGSDSQQKVYEEFLTDIKHSWPINSNFSGSYSASVLYDHKIILSNDVIGPYPLYYFIKDDKFIFTDNLQLFKFFLEVELDLTGIAQRLYGPENSNIGSRTILKDVKKLLPGEKLTFDLLTFEVVREFDNRLFGEIGEDKIEAKTVEAFVTRLKTEIEQLKNYKKPIDVALSGGLDSRLLLGALKKNKDTTCYTYGPPDSYESRVAQRLANCKGFKFLPKTDYLQYFPLKESIVDIIKNSDSPYIMAWFEFLDNIPKEKNILLIGDMCEALPARNIKKFSSRKDRKKNFFKYFLLNKAYCFEESSDYAFVQWKSKIRNRYLRDFEKENFKSQIFDKITKERVLEEVKDDLEELFDRIEAHELKYVELFDELFTWFTHSRVPMGKQITHCNNRFNAVSPSMGSGILVLSSNIHPNLRMNYRFMELLFKEEDFKQLNKIPTSQSPLLSGSTPKVLRFLLWGFRSTVDQILIRRIIQKKNPNIRYRLFKGLNWVEVYQTKNTLEKFNSYFQNNYLGNEIFEETIKALQSRVELSSWPLMNSDIMAPAILNLELECLMEETKDL